MTLLERIAVLRKENGNISINKLEQEVGLTRLSMCKWDKHAPSYDKVKKVADYFGVSVEYLTTGEDKKSPSETDELSPDKKKLLEYVENATPEQLANLLKLLEVAKGIDL